MEQMYAEQRETNVGQKNRDRNDHYVATKLPRQLHAEFYQWLKSRDWSKSRGVRFAIYQLLKSENHESLFTRHHQSHH